MQDCEVRYPTRILVIPALPFVIAMIGFLMAAQGRGHWSYGAAAAWAGIGFLFFLHARRYRTIFTSEGLSQYQFLLPTRHYLYQEIQSIGIGEGKGANTIVLTFTNGKRVRVYGADRQLLRAQALLRARLPHLVHPLL